jgi:S-formylglutathione hydrolase FrmB
MPSDGLWGDGSGYVSHPHADFEKWIIRDVPQVVTEVTRAIDPEARVALSGLSMGGFGALYLGAKYAERVFSISAHSSLTAFAQMTRFVEEPLTNYGIDPAAHTVIDWMRRHDQHLPPIRFDCGHDDPLIEENRLLHAQLTAAQIPHTYEEYPGGHSWDYWQTHLSRSLLHISHSFPR